MELEAQAERRMVKIKKKNKRKDHFQAHSQPRARMEAESRRDQSKQKLYESWMKARIETNNKTETKFIKKFFCTDGRKGTQKLEGSQDGRKNVASSPSTSRQTRPSIKTQKRKLTENNIFVGSPDKRRKLSFKDNLEFWKTQSDNTYTQISVVVIRPVPGKVCDNYGWDIT